MFGRLLSPQGIPRFQMGQLQPDDRCIELVHVRPQAMYDVGITLPRRAAQVGELVKQELHTRVAIRHDAPKPPAPIFLTAASEKVSKSKPRLPTLRSL